MYLYRLTDKPGSWLVVNAPGQDLAEARRTIELQFGAERVLGVREYNPHRGRDDEMGHVYETNE